ncbi:MAG: GNAT family N-acetyltransferase [Chloroflexi bacterium]|nr:GNAT family N-acetyltransferase [Chloroflexota bacterium]
MLTEPVITGEKVRLRDKKLSDAHNDYTWQVDTELARLDAAAPAGVSFQAYLLDYAHQLRFPGSSRRIFAIETRDQRHIGNCSYYNIDRRRRTAELGIMIGDRDFWGKGYGADAVRALLGYVFSETDLRHIYLKTLEWNYRAQRCFAGCGFVLGGFLYQEGHSFIRMEIKREQWEERRAVLRLNNQGTGPER